MWDKVSACFKATTYNVPQGDQSSHFLEYHLVKAKITFWILPYFYVISLNQKNLLYSRLDWKKVDLGEVCIQIVNKNLKNALNLILLRGQSFPATLQTLLLVSLHLWQILLHSLVYFLSVARSADGRKMQSWQICWYPY